MQITNYGANPTILLSIQIIPAKANYTSSGSNFKRRDTIFSNVQNVILALIL